MKVCALKLYRKKGAPGELVSEINLVENIGIEGDYHKGSDKQISILSEEARLWMENQAEKGLCFDKFKENILVDRTQGLKTGNLLSAGATLRITEAKSCYDECSLFLKGSVCLLSRDAFFAMVEQGGVLKTGDFL